MFEHVWSIGYWDRYSLNRGWMGGLSKVGIFSVTPAIHIIAVVWNHGWTWNISNGHTNSLIDSYVKFGTKKCPGMACNRLGYYMNKIQFCQKWPTERMNCCADFNVLFNNTMVFSRTPIKLAWIGEGSFFAPFYLHHSAERGGFPRCSD